MEQHTINVPTPRAPWADLAEAQIRRSEAGRALLDARVRIARLESALRTVLRTLEKPCVAIVDVVWAEGEINSTLLEVCEWALDGAGPGDEQLNLPGLAPMQAAKVDSDGASEEVRDLQAHARSLEAMVDEMTRGPAAAALFLSRSRV
jgi:hypothetical protein